jgi:hypothetical protein
MSESDQAFEEPQQEEKGEPNVEKHFYEFGPLRIDTSNVLLYRGGRRYPNRERVIPKDELLKSVWPDTVVAFK